MRFPRIESATRFFFILIVLLVSGTVASQTVTGSLTGQVVDRHGTPMPGVTVTLRGPDQTRSTITDQSGQFRFPDLPVGEYRLRAELSGFGVAAQTVQVRLGQAQTLSLVLQAAMANGGGEKPFTIVRVFYGTDRKPIISAATGTDYTGERSSTLNLGSCTVSIPKDHRLGDWEKPTIFTVTSDQSRHVILLDVTPHAEAEFVRRLRQRVEQSAGKEAFIFVHGYNVSFSDAVQRTALLAYDLKFDGAPIAFSWPSRADAGLYLADEQSVEFSIPDLENFLTLVANNSGATKIHLIAHSMGNRALLRALSNLRTAGHAPANLAEAVLTAPDVDRDIFTQLVAAITAIARRTTLYASSRDKALKASHKVHDGPRAGEGGKRILLADGVDSIDVSALDTGFLSHSYYADNQSVITDLFDLIHTANGPDQRICLSPRQRQNHKFWVFDRCRGR